MAIDSRIESAIKESVSEHNQREALSNSIIAWFKEVISGNEDFTDSSEWHAHVQVLYDNVEADYEESNE